MSHLLELDDVGVTYRRGEGVVRALSGVTLTISAGEMVAVAGPSGSGKTSLVSVICGWEQADQGRVTWADGLTPGAGGARWATLAVVPQTLGMMPELTLVENVSLPQRLRPGDRPGDLGGSAEELMAALGLDGLADRFPHQVSLGQQQRAALARALVADPALLIADEPSAHLDPEATRLVLAAFAERAGRGGATLIATHDPALLAAADRVVDLGRGTEPTSRPA